MSSKLRNLNALNKYRIVLPIPGGEGDAGNGLFQFGPCRVVASNQDGWDHVSVSLPNRCPTWSEMESVRNMFFTEDAVVMQLSVARSDHINLHP